MPNVVLEALASGLPVVASSIPGNAELVEDGSTGFLFNLEEEDPAKIAERIVILSVDPERRKAMGISARESVAAKYTWEQVGAMYEESFD
jgi:glycosyltransferase involved in cell wall biosynthesis